MSGEAFIFVSRECVRAKVLHFDGTGLCIYAKRLEHGRFAALWSAVDEAPVRLTVSELELFLDGSTVVGRMAGHAAAADAVFPCLRSAAMIQWRRRGVAGLP